jgi:Fucose permease
MKQQKKSIAKKEILIFIILTLLMAALGSSDSLRGIFTKIFQEHFQITTTQVSMIITVSYIGNLFFLFAGGGIIDRFDKKKIFMFFLILWTSCVAAFALTDNFYILLAVIFFCMGASTLLSTTINMFIPATFARSAGIAMNILFCVHGIGASLSQNLVGKYATGFSSWQMMNSGFVVVGIFISVMMLFFKIANSKEKKEDKKSYRYVMKQKEFPYLVLIFGLYFVVEHGIMNWLILYGTNWLEMSTERAAMYLSIFFGTLTVGRLLFSPVVQKLGAAKSISIFITGASILYVAGFLLGSKALFLVSLSGVFFSIIFPTMILLIQKCYTADCAATAVGCIVGVATVFDILFNAIFGKMVDTIGFGKAIFILPIGMVLYYVVYRVFLKRMSTTAEYV